MRYLAWLLLGGLPARRRPARPGEGAGVVPAGPRHVVRPSDGRAWRLCEIAALLAESKAWADRTVDPERRSVGLGRGGLGDARRAHRGCAYDLRRPRPGAESGRKAVFRLEHTAVLGRERLGDGRRRGELERHDDRAERLPGGLLLGERDVQLLGRDQPAVDEQRAERLLRRPEAAVVSEC